MDSQNDTAYLDEINRSLVVLQENRISEAIGLCQKLINENPDKAEAYYMLGLVAVRLEDLGQAMILIEAAHKLDDECREYADALASLYTQAGKLSDGLYYAKLATTLTPHPYCQPFLPPQLANYMRALKMVNPPRYYVDAILALNRRDFDEAIAKAEAELRLNRDHPDAFNVLGIALTAKGEALRGVAAHQGAVHLDPGRSAFYMNLGESLQAAGRFGEARPVLEKALELDPESTRATCALQRGTALGAKAEPGAVKAVQDTWNARFDGVAPAIASERPAGDKLRIGYLGHAFHEGSWASFVTPILGVHDRDKVDVSCFVQSIASDTTTRRMKVYSDNWREIHDLDDDVLASTIVNEGIDVLVDLSGFAAGARMEMLPRRVAPLQVSWSGFGGYGVTGVDVVLSDPVLRDADEALLGEGQALEVVETGLFTADPPALLANPSAPPAAERDWVTLGATLDLTRFTGAIVAHWARVLHRGPHLHLLLGGEGAASEDAQRRVLEIMANFGVANRVSFHAAPEGMDSAMDRKVDQFKEVDLWLDMPALEAPHDVCDALWMGVPVVALQGATRPERLGASLLTAAGKADWVGADSDAFVDKVLALADDVSTLAGIRENLRDEVRESALFTPETLTGAIEAAFERLMSERRG